MVPQTKIAQRAAEGWTLAQVCELAARLSESAWVRAALSDPLSAVQVEDQGVQRIRCSSVPEGWPSRVVVVRLENRTAKVAVYRGVDRVRASTVELARSS